MTKEGSENVFYIKQRNKSFRKCKWMKEEEILRLDPSARAKVSRFAKEVEQGLKRQNELYNFDSASLEVDRILDCSELFPVLHPKKSSQM